MVFLASKTNSGDNLGGAIFLFSEKTRPWICWTCFGYFELKNNENPNYLWYFCINLPPLGPPIGPPSTKITPWDLTPKVQRPYLNLRQYDIIGILVILIIFVILIPFFKNMGVFLDTRSGEASQLPGGAFFFGGGGDFFRKNTYFYVFSKKWVKKDCHNLNYW